jgi:hypothetical protein
VFYCACHWKLNHTLKKLVVGQFNILANFSLFGKPQDKKLANRIDEYHLISCIATPKFQFQPLPQPHTHTPLPVIHTHLSNGYHVGRAGHWKLNHTLKNLVVGQFNILANFSLFTLVRASKPLFRSFGFSVQPAFVAFILFNYICGPLDEVRGSCMSLVSLFTGSHSTE